MWAHSDRLKFAFGSQKMLDISVYHRRPACCTERCRVWHIALCAFVPGLVTVCLPFGSDTTLHGYCNVAACACALRTCVILSGNSVLLCTVALACCRAHCGTVTGRAVRTRSGCASGLEWRCMLDLTAAGKAQWCHRRASFC